MGENFQTIVVPGVQQENAPRLAEAVLKFLIEREIISPERTDCTLGAGGGHPPASRFEEAVVEASSHVRRLRTNGMDVVIRREVFHNGGAGLDAVRCPMCGANQVDGDWGTAVDAWYAGDDKAPLACDACHATSPLTQWSFEPPWGFACLAFTFWNWPPLKPEFIRQVSDILQQKVLLVAGKL
jgi:hypothetical protein